MRTRTFFATLAFLFLILAAAGAEGVDPVRAIGMDLKTALGEFGVPQSMFPFRGSEEARDDVVFYYPDHMYLFWFRDRVWQVRFDRRSSASVMGFAIGMSREQAQAAAGAKGLLADGDSLYFDDIEHAFPVRVRLAFAGGTLTDIYVYRSDF